MVALLPLFRRTVNCIIVLTVWSLVAGNTAGARDTRSITEYLLNAFTKACRVIMESYGEEPENYNETKKLKVILFGPSEWQTFPINEAAEQIRQTGLFTDRDMTVITIHGFNDRAESDASLEIAKAYQAKGRHNTILLDSSELISGNYMRASTMTTLIGQRLAYFISNMNMNPKLVHLIGISLGAHIAGFTGKFYNKINGTKLHRITALDPAGPCFSFAAEKERLNRNDAEFVDVIHTNLGIQGIAGDVGHVDFYVNGGGPGQPGCDGTHCSHERAVLYFLESFQNHSKPFMARNCHSWRNFNRNYCDNNRITQMGSDTPTSMKGRFFLRTSEREPFSLGDLGAVP